MHGQKNIIDCYDKTARNYAGKYINELEHKHLDQILLTAFAAANRDKGRLIDLGCGPGQTTKFLSSCGWKDIVGTDLSPVMIRVAREINPHLQFETADMLRLPYPQQSFAAAVAFYSIVHFDEAQLRIAFNGISSLLKDKGQFLFSFHIGDNLVHLDNFLDQEVNIDFHFFDPQQIISLLRTTGFEIIDSIEREHYPELEYPSKRAYIWAKKINSHEL